MRPKNIRLNSLSDDDDGIAQDQTIGGAGNLVLNGALVTDGVAIAGAGQQVQLESVANLSAINFTITGTSTDSVDNQTVSETIAGPNAGTTATTLYFKTVTQIAVSAAVGTDVKAGWVAANGAVTQSVPVSYSQVDFKNSYQVALTTGATLTYTVDHTSSQPEYQIVDGVRENWSNGFQAGAEWLPTTGLTGLSASQDGNIAFPIRAVRLRFSAYTSGSALFTIMQGT